MQLSQRQSDALNAQGYLSPLEFCSANEMATRRPALLAALQRPRIASGEAWGPRDQDCLAVQSIVTGKPVLDAVESVLGPDLTLWNCTFFNKDPGGSPVPWHQDRDFLYLSPPTSVTVWLAIDDADRSNGCLEMLPGTHGEQFRHTTRTNAGEFDAMADIDQAAAGQPDRIELRAGQFVIFFGGVLHRSGPNASAGRRLGLVMRYTTPAVRVDMGPGQEDYTVYLVRGQDRYGLNRLAQARH